MKFVKALILIVLFVLVVVFVIQNKESFLVLLNLKFNVFGWNWSSSLPVYWALVISFLIGAILVWLYLLSDSIRKNRELKAYRQRIEELEEELESMQGVEFTEEEASYDKDKDLEKEASS